MEKPHRDLLMALRRTANGRMTVDLPSLWQCFDTVRPELKGDITRRQRLAADLRALADDDAISLPASKSSFDRTALPALPRFVRLLANPAEPAEKFDHRTFPWSLPMSFVAGLARLPNPAHARRLNDFFRGDWAARVLVPVKERSYEIFGNEKTLEKILAGQLGYEGRLTLEKLRCYRVPLTPVHRTFFATSPDLLIVENEAAFDTVCRWNTERLRFRLVIYGRGREVEKISEFLRREMQSQPGVIYYFGDLDRLGITMPHRLARTLEQAGSASLIPAAACYRLLIQQAPATITAVDASDESDEPPDAEWATALGWLPEDVRHLALLLLSADERIAQEAIGWELLRSVPSLV